MLLIVSDRAEFFEEIAVRLHMRGIYAFQIPCCTADFYCKSRDTGGVILDCTEDLHAGEALCRKIRDTYPDMPIAAVILPTHIPNMPATRMIRSAEALHPLFEEILDFCRTACGWNTEALSTYSLSVTQDRTQTQYMGYLMPLSEREHRILHFLFYRAPQVTTLDDLLSLCYPEGGVKAGNVVEMISRINRHAKRIDPRPLIINIRNKGYRLRDGIL